MKAKKKSNYRSGHESKVALCLQKHKIPFLYEPEVIRYSEEVRGGICLCCGETEVVKFRNYLPDFVSTNSKIVLEAKGKFTPQDRTKMLNVRKSNPNIEVIMVFQYDNWLTKTKKRRYSTWCKYNELLYCVGPDLPKWVLDIMRQNK